MARLVLALREPSREADGAAVSQSRQPVDVRAAGVRQAEQSPDLVEGLARGVVERSAEFFDVGRYVACPKDRRVPAGDHEADEMLGERAVGRRVDAQMGQGLVLAV